MFSETIYNIINTDMRLWPWPHVIYDNIFSKKDYENIVKNLPEEKILTPIINIHGKMSDYSRKRLILHDYDGLCENKKIFWTNLKKNFTNGKLKKLILKKYYSIFKERFINNSLSNYLITETFQLTLDKPDYFLPPHTDSIHKLYTIVINLTESKEHSKMGTLILNEKEPIQTDDRKKKFNLANQTLYLPNKGVGIVKTFDSWHAVNKTEHDRWTIQYTIWAKPKNDT